MGFNITNEVERVVYNYMNKLIFDDIANPIYSAINRDISISHGIRGSIWNSVREPVWNSVSSAYLVFLEHKLTEYEF